MYANVRQEGRVTKMSLIRKLSLTISMPGFDAIDFILKVLRLELELELELVCEFIRRYF